MDFLFNHPSVIAGILLAILVLSFSKIFLRIFGVVLIPDDSIGTVTKRFVILGSNRTLPDGQIVALKGEAGYQADTLSPWTTSMAVAMAIHRIISQVYGN